MGILDSIVRANLTSEDLAELRSLLDNVLEVESQDNTVAEVTYRVGNTAIVQSQTDIKFWVKDRYISFDDFYNTVQFWQTIANGGRCDPLMRYIPQSTQSTGGGGYPTLTTPSEFTADGSGTAAITLRKVSQPAGRVWASPPSAAGAPIFQQLAIAHLSHLIGQAAGTLAAGNDDRFRSVSDVQSIAQRSIDGTAPINYSAATGIISIRTATSGQSGALSATDWSTFNNKQDANTRLNAIASQANPTSPKLFQLGTNGGITFVDPSSNYDPTNVAITGGSISGVSSLNSAGDTTISCVGSTFTSPRILGLSDLGPTRAARFQFGDINNSIATRWDGVLQYQSYWEMHFYPFNQGTVRTIPTGNAGGPHATIWGTFPNRPILSINTPASHVSNILEFTNSSNVVLSAIDNTGKFPANMLTGTIPSANYTTRLQQLNTLTAANAQAIGWDSSGNLTNLSIIASTDVQNIARSSIDSGHASLGYSATTGLFTPSTRLQQLHNLTAVSGRAVAFDASGNLTTAAISAGGGNAPRILFKNSIQQDITGTTTETTFTNYSFTFAAGTIATDSVIDIEIFFATSGGAGTKIIRMKFGSSNIYSSPAVVSGAQSVVVKRSLRFRGSLNSQYVFPGGSYTSYGNTAIAPVSTAFDFSVNQTLTITTTNTSAADTASMCGIVIALY